MRSIVVFMICLVLASIGSIGETQKLTNNCLLATRVAMIHKCTGSYTKGLHKQFGDKLMNVGMPYSVFQYENMVGHYFITLRENPLHECKKFKVVNTQSFICMDTEEKPIATSSGGILCKTLNGYAEALIKNCVHAKNEKSMAEPAFASFHYPGVGAKELQVRDQELDKEAETSGQSMINSTKFLLLISLLILIKYN